MKIKSILLAIVMLFFVGSSFAADKVVDAKAKTTKVKNVSSLETKKNMPTGENCCSVTMSSDGFTVSGSACCTCTKKDACSRAAKFASTFF
jgi:hypothetical protein